MDGVWGNIEASIKGVDKSESILNNRYIFRYGGLLASLRCVTLVNTVALAIFGGQSRLSKESIKEPALSSDSEDEDDEDDDDDDWTTGALTV